MFQLCCLALPKGRAVVHDTAKWANKPMISEMMGTIMMWGMGLAGILGLLVIVLVIAAPIKYLFFR